MPLLSVLSKVLRTTVASRVMEHLERHHLLRTRQLGFRKGRSAADLYLLLTMELRASLDQDEGTTVVTLDTGGAFDWVWHAPLVTKLSAADIEGAFLPLLRDYLGDRYLKVAVSGH